MRPAGLWLRLTQCLLTDFLLRCFVAAVACWVPGPSSLLVVGCRLSLFLLRGVSGEEMCLKQHTWTVPSDCSRDRWNSLTCRRQQDRLRVKSDAAIKSLTLKHNSQFQWVMLLRKTFFSLEKWLPLLIHMWRRQDTWKNCCYLTSLMIRCPVFSRLGASFCICMSVFSFKEKVTRHHHVLVMKEGSQWCGPSQHIFNLLKKPFYLNPLWGEKHITSQVFKKYFMAEKPL